MAGTLVCVDGAAARGDSMAGAMAALGAALLATVTRFGAVFRGEAVVLRRTVFFGAGFAAFTIRAAGRFATAALPVGFLALVGDLVDRVATAALAVFLTSLATRLSGRLAFAPAAVFALAAALAGPDFDFAGLAGRLAAAARPDDFDALLFLETARAIDSSLVSTAAGDADHDGAYGEHVTRRR